MTNYTRGRAFEYAIKHDLDSRGFWTLRSAGSHGIVDLVAVSLDGEGTLLFVQAKRDGRISPADRKILCNIAALASAHPILASKATGALIYQLLTENGVRMEISPSELSSIGLEDDDEDDETPKETEA